MNVRSGAECVGVLWIKLLIVIMCGNEIVCAAVSGDGVAMISWHVFGNVRLKVGFKQRRPAFTQDVFVHDDLVVLSL